jgi:hypothetical protein
MKYAIFSILLLFALTGSAAEPDWTKPARRLTGESGEVRAEAIRKLKAIPGLEARLSQALGELGRKAALALDVVVALHLVSLFDEIKRISEQDETGFSYLALDALVDSARTPALTLLYIERLTGPRTSDPAKVILLDSLIRMGVGLDSEVLLPLLLGEKSSPEVKSAALYYLRGRLVQFKDFSELPALGKALEAPLSRQRRVQALALVSELPAAALHRLGRVRVAGGCPDELPTSFKALCEKLASGS